MPNGSPIPAAAIEVPAPFEIVDVVLHLEVSEDDDAHRAATAAKLGIATSRV